MKSRTIKKIMALGTGIAMLGATMTGALALSYTLSDYPQPFIKDGIFNGAIAIGTNAMAVDTIASSILLSDLQTKAVSTDSDTTKVIEGLVGKEEEVGIGSKIMDEFDSGTIDDGDLDILQDGVIQWNGRSYNIHDEIVFSDGLSVESSLTTDSDYAKDVVIEAKRNSIIYQYAFDDNIDLDGITTLKPLKIKFLGRDLQITGKDSNSLTVNYGNKYVLEEGDTVSVDTGGLSKKTVEITKVGQNSIVVNVDGVSDIVSPDNAEVINGVEVNVDDIVYTSDANFKNVVSVFIGSDVRETIEDGDYFFNDEQYVWDLSKMDESKPVLTVKLDESFNSDDDDGLVRVGDCYNLPDDFVKVCLSELKNDNYGKYEVYLDDSYDLSDVSGYSQTSANVFVLRDEDEGISLNGVKTKEMALFVNGTNVDAFYKDNDDNKIKLASSLAQNMTHTSFATLKNEDTSLNMDLVNPIDLNSTNPATLLINEGNGDYLSVVLGKSSSEFNKIGSSADTSESTELKYNSKDIGTKSNDLRTKYGIIVKNPDSNGANDRVSIEVPEDRIKANVLVGYEGEGNTTTTVSGSGKIVKINPIPSTAIVLAEEITNPQAQNLIVIGGPAVNPLANLEGFPDISEYKPNEAMVRLADNGNKVALLVAGYSAMDTRNAAEAVVAGKLKDVSQIEIRVLSPSQQLRVYTIETE